MLFHWFCKVLEFRKIVFQRRRWLGCGDTVCSIQGTLRNVNHGLLCCIAEMSFAACCFITSVVVYNKHWHPRAPPINRRASPCPTIDERIPLCAPKCIVNQYRVLWYRGAIHDFPRDDTNALRALYRCSRERERRPIKLRVQATILHVRHLPNCAWSLQAASRNSKCLWNFRFVSFRLLW